MIAKEKFINCINRIIKQYDAIKELYNDFTRLFGNFEGDGTVSEVVSVDLPIKILTEAMDDKDEWIEYFIYECDCGRGKKEVKWWDEEKTELIETPEQLYDIIIKSHKQDGDVLVDATANGFYILTPEEQTEICQFQHYKIEE